MSSLPNVCLLTACTLGKLVVCSTLAGYIVEGVTVAVYLGAHLQTGVRGGRNGSQQPVQLFPSWSSH